MRVVIQRVNKAQVAIDNEVVGKIKRGRRGGGEADAGRVYRPAQ